jgi:hypothetical protein
MDAVAMLEIDDNLFAAIVIQHLRPGGGEMWRVGNAIAAQHAVADWRRDEMDRPPSMRAQRVVRADRHVATKAQWRQKEIKRFAGNLEPTGRGAMDMGVLDSGGA